MFGDEVEDLSGRFERFFGGIGLPVLCFGVGVSSVNAGECGLGHCGFG